LLTTRWHTEFRDRWGDRIFQELEDLDS
jgi:hypothetical protein